MLSAAAIRSSSLAIHPPLTNPLLPENLTMRFPILSAALALGRLDLWRERLLMAKGITAVRVELHSNKVLQALAASGKAGLVQAAKLVKQVADSKVPTGGETGLLEASGVIREYIGSSTAVRGPVVDVRYGGNGAYWGVILHAHPEYEFQQGRRADFIEAATLDTHGIAMAMAEGVRTGFKRII